MSLVSFHPAIQKWFASKFGAPTPPQARGWPPIRAGKHTLIAAPTGSGKTLAAFLSAIDVLIRQGPYLPDETQVLYVSPLKALSNDIQKNLQGPLAEIVVEDLFLPSIRVLVRTGDTPAKDRAKMLRKPPHILVTTPESLYLLLTSRRGRGLLATVRTVIVDEIHALARDKRGAHLALSLERLEALAGPVQRIGLSATQKPLEDTARFLVGTGRDCEVVDAGHLRELDLAVEVPNSPLGAVCSHEVWEEIYARLAELIRAHRTTLIFTNTRKLAERLAARLTGVLGEDQVTCHHGSLSKGRRLDAEQRLKAGKLRALVATASLELGLDIGEVDLAVQIAGPRSIATFLQRIGRSGHGLDRVPKGRLFPLTLDELAEAAALLRSVRRGELDRTPQPAAPVDILAQQLVAACVPEAWSEDELFERFRRAWPYRALVREDFDAAASLHTQGRYALLHRDGVNRRLMAARRARLVALSNGGAIPDTALYQVLAEPGGTPVGTLDEDFAVESNAGDIFQLGNTSWRILRVESRAGVVRVADAKGQPPSIPFWLGEAPARTAELSAAVAELREEYAIWRCQSESPSCVLKEALGGGTGFPACAAQPGKAVPPSEVEQNAAGAGWLARETGVGEAAARQIAEYFEAGLRALGAMPTQKRVVLERFFDESGGMQLVVHAPFGGRVNRAWGLALRKRFCRGFGFELQAAANEESIVLSLGPQHSFPLESVFDYLHPGTAREVLVQALLATPLFTTRWRWNVTRALLVERSRQGKRTPAPLVRMRAEDALVAAFPQALACPETLPPGDLPVPMEHPLVRQSIEDCLTEAMNLEGFLEVLRGLREGRIERVAVDTPEPSAFARGILSAQPYSFLDDAPLEERRTQAVLARRTLDPREADGLGALDPEAIRRVREEAWPSPENAEELHEALLWMGFVIDSEAARENWRPWLEELSAAKRVARDRVPDPLASLSSLGSEEAWFAVETAHDPKTLLRGRLEALGPVLAPPNEPLFLELETEGVVLRGRFEGREGWCHRRLLARIQRYTLDRLRREIEPVSAAEFLRFLACWQHVDEAHKLEGPRGVGEAVRQLAGFEVPAAAWESGVLPARVRGYRREWLDQLTLSGELAWGRLWMSERTGAAPVRGTPLCLFPREDLDVWFRLSATAKEAGTLDFELAGLSGNARAICKVLLARGALFPQDLARAVPLLPAHREAGLGELIAQGLLTCDSFGGLRQLLVPVSRRRHPLATVGRWSLLPARVPAAAAAPAAGMAAEERAEFVARQLLRRTGLVFRRTAAREKIPVPWRDLLRVFRRLEMRGEVRGGRFVAGFDGEQYALPEAVALLREVRKRVAGAAVQVSAADPLNFRGILTPDERISPLTRRRVLVG